MENQEWSLGFNNALQKELERIENMYIYSTGSFCGTNTFSCSATTFYVSYDIIMDMLVIHSVENTKNIDKVLTAILKVFNEYCARLGLKRIIFRNVCDDAYAKWCAHNKMIVNWYDHPHCYLPSGFATCCDYILEVDDYGDKYGFMAS